MPSSELQLLLQALEERNIGLGADDVTWAFESAGTKGDAQRWVREYLTPTFLLSSEERAFAEKQGQTAYKDASSCQQVSHQSFEEAISSLESSTAAIDKQCRLLETQRQALEKIKERAGARDGGGKPKDQSNSKIGRERSQLEFESNELADSLQAKFRTAIKQSESTSSNTQPTVERALEKDDRLLDGLEKVLPHISTDGDDGASTEEAERLCQALKLLINADIRSRIDAAYLDGAHQHASQANGINGKATRETQQLASLNAELDELCREIDGLSTMAVENQYRNPIIHATNTAKADTEMEKASWAEYLGSTMQYSTTRMEHLLEQLEDQRAHTSATRAISAALEEVLAASKDTQDDSQRTSRSPTKATQKGLKPLRLVQANLSDPQDPASQLLRLLDVRTAGELDAAALNRPIVGKVDKLEALRANTERNVSDQIAQSLAGADADVQQLLGAVFAHSQYGSVHLESDDVRTGISGLETKTQDLSEKMRGLNTDDIVKTARAKQRELFDQIDQR